MADQSPHFYLKLRYSGYYFFTVSFYAFIFSFFPLHCKAIGFSAQEIGRLGALTSLAAIIAAPLTLQAAHSFLAPRRLFPLLLGAALLAYLPLTSLTAFLTLAVCWFLVLCFKIGGDALIDVEAVRAAAQGLLRFERVRVFGSIGFVVINFALGALVSSYGTEAIIPAGLGLLILTACFGLSLNSSVRRDIGRAAERSAAASVSEHSWTALLLLFVTVGLCYGSHSVLYLYFSLYLDALAWSPSAISLAWNIGVAAEIVLFALFYRMEQRWTLVQILRIGLLLTIVRWLVLAFTQHSTVLLISQILHAFSFGASYLASIQLARRLSPAWLHDRAQAILISCGAGVGSFLGRLVLSQAVGELRSYLEVQQLFVGAAAAAGVALVCSVLIREVPRAAAESAAAEEVPTGAGTTGTTASLLRGPAPSSGGPEAA